MMGEAEIVLRNARQMFDDEYLELVENPILEKLWKHSKITWIIRAKQNKPYKKGGYYFPQPKGFRPYFKTEEERVDWKDFRYNVCRTHTWVSPYETYYSIISAFNAWRNQNMTIEEVNQPEEEETAQIISFPSIVTGGFDGSGNWLSHLEEGDVFHSRVRAENSPDSEQWHLKYKFLRTAILYSNFPQSRDFYRLVDMAIFSKQNDWLETIQNKQETENG